MRILVTGGRGQLGRELHRCLKKGSAEIGPLSQAYENAQVDFVDYDELDISSAHAVSAWFKTHEYDFVINCAAFTNVDGCEREEAQAYRVNAHGPENLARVCQAQGAKFLHVSTDYVFPGTNPVPRVETDGVCPISAYGRSKWAGEVLALAACEKTFIVRTAWLYGYEGNNFVKTMLRLAQKNGAISVVSDQLGNPTSANDLAYEILAIGLTENYGIYHCTNNGTCSWFDFALAVVEAAGISCEKEALTSAEYKKRFPQSADRPAYSSLDNAYLRATIGDKMRPWEEALACYMAHFDTLAD